MWIPSFFLNFNWQEDRTASSKKSNNTRTHVHTHLRVIELLWIKNSAACSGSLGHGWAQLAVGVQTSSQRRTGSRCDRPVIFLCVSADWLHPVRADGCWSVKCESPAASGVLWTGISAKPQLFYLSLSTSASSPLPLFFIHFSENITKLNRERGKTTNFFSLAWLFCQSSTFPLHSSCFLSSIHHVSCVCICVKNKKTQKQVKSSVCHQLVIVLITQKQNDNIFSNQLKDASHLPLNKTYYLSSFCTRGNGHRPGWCNAKWSW